MVIFTGYQPLLTTVDCRSSLDLPTSRALKAELGARKMYTMEAKTEQEARGKGIESLSFAAGPPTTEKATKDFGKV